MFLPYSDNNDTQRFPVVNYLFIALNVVVYLALNLRPDAWEIMKPFALVAGNAHATTFITYAFLHGGFFHLFGNMLFLHIYGDNIEDKLGHIGYFFFYLAAAVVAGFFHISTSSLPCVGASGAVAGVMGAYIVFFPTAKIRCLLFFIPIIKKVEIYSWVILSFWFVGQLLDHFADDPGAQVAFAAHIGGFLCGNIVSGLLILANVVEIKERPRSRILSRDPVADKPATPRAVPAESRKERFEEEKKRGVPCPACIKAMQFMQIDNLQIDTCFDCGGLWLDRGETEVLLRRSDLPYSLLNPPARDPKSAVVAPGERVCGRCEVKLQLAPIEGITAEGCPSCGGLWLERGRLGALKQKLDASA